MKRNELKQPGYFHLHNKGNNRKKLFYGEDDFYRFIKSALLFQFSRTIPNLHRLLIKQNLPKPIENKAIELKAFHLTDYHFELVLYQNKPSLISKYMHRLITSYTKYYNQRYNHEGALFRGAYKLNELTNPSLMTKMEEINTNTMIFSSGYDVQVNNRWNEYFNSTIR